MKKKQVTSTIVTILVIAGIIAGIGWVLSNNKKKNEAKTTVVAQSSGSVAVRTAVVEKESISTDFRANGNFTPARQLNFAAENSGRVVRILVDEGSHVKKGQTLAIINADAINIDLETANAAYQNAMKDKQRYENAFTTGGVTQQQLDQARLALENSEARLEQAKIRVRDANVRSSINGIVNKRYIEPGAYVSPGTQLFELVDVSKLRLNISVSEAQVARLQTGDKVKVMASVLPDKTFEGKISFIAPKSDNTLNFPVEIEIAQNPGNRLRAGMYGTAMFSFDNEAPAIMVPRTAFIGGVNSNRVFVARDGKAYERGVVSGRIIGDQVEILEGLAENDTVITSGQINLSEGSSITIIK